MSVAVVALLADGLSPRELEAGFEEEGVPLAVGRGAGGACSLAVDAARRSQLGLGIGGDGSSLALVLAAWPAKPYLTGHTSEARAFARAAARIAARRPLDR